MVYTDSLDSPYDDILIITKLKNTRDIEKYTFILTKFQISIFFYEHCQGIPWNCYDG